MSLARSFYFLHFFHGRKFSLTNISMTIITLTIFFTLTIIIFPKKIYTICKEHLYLRIFSIFYYF